MSARWARAFAATLATVLLTGAGEAPEARIEQYQRARREAMEAAVARDRPKAETILTGALSLFPDVPGSYIRLARTQAALGKTDLALANLATYARMGLTLDVANDPALKVLIDQPAYKQEVAPLLEKNATPFGDVGPVAVLAGEPGFIGEDLAHDGKGWLLSTVSGRTIVRLSDGGGSPFLQADADTGAIFGMAVDGQRGVLWAAEAWGERIPGGSGPPRTGLLKVSLADGRILGRVPVPQDGARRQLGDVVVAADGTVYASDAVEGGVWELTPGGELRPLVADGRMISAQGMALCPDGRAMVVADYSTGLHRIDLNTGEIAPMSGLRTGMAGTDGLVVAPGIDFGLRAASPLPFAVIATQNGVSPQRVMLLRISHDCREVEDSALVAANLPLMDDLALATMHDGAVVFIGHARWAERDATGALTRPPGPIRVLRALLPRIGY